MSHADPERLNFALIAVGELCTHLAAEGCTPAEVATALASLLGAVTAAVDCCDEHALMAEDVVAGIFEESLATHRVRYAAFKRDEPAADFPAVEGHA